jgi:hypothetical protein
VGRGSGTEIIFQPIGHQIVAQGFGGDSPRLIRIS